MAKFALGSTTINKIGIGSSTNINAITPEYLPNVPTAGLLYWWDMNNTASYNGGSSLNNIGLLGNATFGVVGGGSFATNTAGKNYYRTGGGTKGNLAFSEYAMTGSLTGYKPQTHIWIGSRNDGNAYSSFWYGGSGFGGVWSNDFVGTSGGLSNIVIQTGGFNMGYGTMYGYPNYQNYDWTSVSNGDEFTFSAYTIQPTSGGNGTVSVFIQDDFQSSATGGIVSMPSSVTFSLQGSSTVYDSSRLQTEGGDHNFAAWLLYDRVLTRFELIAISDYYTRKVGLNFKQYY